MKENIAMVIEHYFDPTSGGVQQSTSKLASIFKEKGHNVIIASIFKTNKNIQQWNSINIYYTGEEQVKELSALLRLYNINIVINQAGYNVAMTKTIRQSVPPGTKLVNTLRINPLNFVQNHRIYIEQFLKEKKLGFINNRFTRSLILKYHYRKQHREYLSLLENVDALILLSESFKQEIYQLCPEAEFLKEKIVAIPNPFQITNFNYSNEIKQNVILFVGRLTIIQKRIDILMSLWKRLHNQLPDWEFWIVGYGEEENNMKEFCRKNNLTRVKFFGKDKPDSYYEKAKILHFTSAFEGFGNVLIEAQRFGCVPVLFDSYSAAKDIITDGINGYLVTPFNQELFIEKTLQLIKDPRMLESMSSGSIKNSKRYSYDNIYELWENLFDKISSFNN